MAQPFPHPSGLLGFQVQSSLSGGKYGSVADEHPHRVIFAEEIMEIQA